MHGHARRLGPGRYLVRISAGRDPITGKRSQPSRMIHGSRQDAELALAELRIEHSRRWSPSCDTTLNVLVEEFLSAPTRSGRRREPGSRYRELCRYQRHVQPGMGHRVADGINSHELTRLYDALLAKGLKPASVRLIHALIRGAFAWGEKRGHVSSNPAKLADCPTVRMEPPSAPSMETVQQHLRILQEDDPETALVVRLAATIGLRRNEISGLRWAHIDLDRGLVSISEGIIVVPGEGLSVTSTKTGLHGHGVLSIDEGLVDLLRDTRERLEKVAADIGEDVPSDAYVVSSDLLHRTPINPDTLTKRLRNHMDRHPEIPSFTLKDLRAFTATMLEATGADITTAQAVLRHASGQTTMRHYRAARMDRVRGATVDLGRQIDGV
jgi:integrase